MCRNPFSFGYIVRVGLGEPGGDQPVDSGRVAENNMRNHLLEAQRSTVQKSSLDRSDAQGPEYMQIPLFSLLHVEIEIPCYLIWPVHNPWSLVALDH